MRVAVIGGGIAGATAALDLADAGAEVVVLEAAPRLGGLVVSFEVAGTPLECFYHHMFPNEDRILSLLRRLHLDDRVEWLPSTMGVLTDGRVWPFTGALDLLRFGPLSPLQRVRLGAGALRLMRTPHWEPLDDRPALDWLAATTGPAAARELWAPLLRAKFGPAADTVPAAWMWGRFEQRKAARDRGGEKLGYLRGGFRQLFDALHDELTAAGVEVRTGVRVSSLDLQEDRVRGVVTDTGAVPADVVLFTGGMPGLFGLVPERHHDPRWNPRGLGVLCVVVEASRPATDVYWTNVCDPRLPFGGLIEHTNLLPAADYGGRHVFYLSRYFTHEEPVAQADPHDEARRWLAALAQHYPAFDPATVLAVHPFRTPYAAPLVDLGYGRRMAPFRTSLDGLFVCTTAQIYPHDRGMNEGIVMGSRVVDEILGRSGGHR